MANVYPINPTVGQIITVGGTRKMWDGVKWKNVTHGNHELRLQFAEKSAALMTVAQAQLSDLKVGQYVRLTDRGLGLFEVIPAGVSDGYYIIALNNGLRLKCVWEPLGYIEASWFGVNADSDDIYPAWFVLSELTNSIGEVTDNKPQVSLPSGYLVSKAPLPLNGYSITDGRGKNKTYLVAHATEFVGDALLVNAQSLYHSRVELGGLTVLATNLPYAYKISLTSGGIAAYNKYSDIAFMGATSALLYCDRDFISNDFIDVDFDGLHAPTAKAYEAPSGLTWNVTFERGKFVNLGDRSFQSSNANRVTFNSTWFEDGGALGKDVINVSVANQVVFNECWFESCHVTLLTESQSKNGVYFNNCEFVAGFDGTNSLPFEFVSDGRINFGSNAWNESYTCKISTPILVSGANGKGFRPTGNVYYFDHISRESARTKKLTAPTVGNNTLLFNVTRTDTPIPATDSLASAKLTVDVICAYYLNGGLFRLVSKRYEVGIGAVSSAIMSVTSAEISDTSSYANTNALIIDGVSATSASFWINNQEFNTADFESAYCVATVSIDTQSNTENAYFQISLP